MIFITGDLHGAHDIRKLSTGNFPQQKKLTRSDYVIICGDFGLLWDGSPVDQLWINWLENKPWTTLWIDGNHENFDMLKAYPVQDWHGGQVQKITEHILHLCRGSVFELDGMRIFTFGGAESHDKKHRIPGVSIWDEELPNSEEMEYGRQTLETANWQVDVVITHSLPQSIQKDLYGDTEYPRNDLTLYFDELNQNLDFRLWFFGHYHQSLAYDEKHYLIYNNIVKLTEGGFERIYPIFRDTTSVQNRFVDINI